MSRSSKRPKSPAAPAAGFSLIELLGVLAVLGIVLALAVPPFLQASARLRVTMAAHEIAGVLRQTRMRAVGENAHVAVRFTHVEGSDDRIQWAIYADGDGDGVRTRDIRSGRDPLLDGPRLLRRFDTTVRPGFPDGPTPREPGRSRRRLGRPKDPLRFGRSDLVSFGPLGTSTPGTLYLTDGARWTAAVRVTGPTGRVRVLVYDPKTEIWR